MDTRIKLIIQKYSYRLWLMFIGILPLYSFAQTDSLYIDTKPKDGITKLNQIYSCQRQILTAEQIRLSGYTRLSELLQLADASTFTTINGNEWYMQTNATGNYQNQSWVLMVNGQRVDMLKLGLTDVNALGIAIYDIERIEFVNTPEMYLGEYADKGLIHIITKKPLQGFSIQGSLAAYGFGTTKVSYAKEKFSMGITFTKNHDLTSVAFNSKSPNMDILRLQTNFEGKKMVHQFSASVADVVGSYSSEDLNRIPYSLNPSLNLGYLTSYKFNNTFSLRFSSNYTVIPLRSYWTKDDLTTYYFNSNLSLKYRKPLKKDIVQLTTGISLDARPWYFSATYFSFEKFLHQNTLLKPYINYSRPLNRKTYFNADASIVYSTYDGKIGYKTSLALYKRVSILTNWSLVAFAGQKAQAELSSVNYVGYEHSLITTNTYNIQPAQQPQQYSFSGNYAINIGNNFKLAFNTSFNSLQNEYFSVIGYTNSYYPSSKINYFNARTFNNVFRFNVHHDVFDNLYLDFNYMRNTQLSGHTEMASNIPKHKTTLILNYKLVKGVQIWSRNFYQSATTWYYLETLNSTIPPYLGSNNKLPSMFGWDLGFTVRTKNEKFQMNLTAPIVGSDIQYYQYSSYYIRLRASLVWKLDRIFASSNGNQ